MDAVTFIMALSDAAKHISILFFSDRGDVIAYRVKDVVFILLVDGVKPFSCLIKNIMKLLHFS